MCASQVGKLEDGWKELNSRKNDGTGSNEATSMSWHPNIRYGTVGYPEKVARRLRGFNIAVWIAALIPAGMAIVRFIDEKWKVGAADVLVATTYASMPLLHRFG